MLDFAAYVTAQSLTDGLAQEALPNAPVRAHQPRVRRTLPQFQIRQRFSLTLRRLADAIEPRSSDCEPAMPSYR